VPKSTGAQQRITTETETSDGSTSARSYGYDLDGRLTDVISGGQTVAHYAYDANGNRLSKTSAGTTVNAAFNDQDQLVSQGSLQFTYTKDGERATRTDTATGAVTRYTYDGFSNLTGVELPDGRQITYVIDPAGRRVGKKVDGQLTQGLLYGPEAQGPIAQLDAQGNVTARFVYGTRSHVPDHLIKNGQTYALIPDARGSPRMVVDTQTGQVAQRLSYDEHGDTTQDTNPGFQPFGYAGGMSDPDTGLIRFGARDYDPQTGRWTAKDPIGFQGGDTNLYGYVLGDPVNLIDPDGTFAILPVLAGGLLAAEVGITAHDINKLVHGCGNAVDLALDAAGPVVGGLAALGRGGKWLAKLADETGSFDPLARRWRSTVNDFRTDPGAWRRASAHVEEATGRRYRGGLNVEEVFERGSERLVRHRIYGPGGDILKESYRPYAKFGAR
jgi:RHS repeat-associated protein